MLQITSLSMYTSNHSSTEYKTNYRAKFNFIGIKKKTESVPKFFLKGKQIKKF